MAKSLRSKAKLAARKRKATESHYAVAEAARTARVSAKLLKKDENAIDAEGGEEEDAEMKEGELPHADWADAAEPKKVSTSGPRESRREQWRISKGMDARPKHKGQNHLGRPVSRTKAGRTKRRR